MIELPQITDRLTFLYLERCTVHRDANALTATDQRGTIHIPGATLSCLLLGPGTRITHQAMALIGDCGATVAWVGEGGVRMYASGRSLARSTRLLQAQVACWSDPRRRVETCRAMYAMRFPDDACDGLTISQMRGKEGSRVRKVYRNEANRVGITWKGRHYDQEDWAGTDAVNQALSAANAALYGVVHAVIAALGLSPGLGFIHDGNALAFVHDVSDLYKAETTIPIAFDIAAEGVAQVDTHARQRIRARATEIHLLERVVADLRTLLQVDQGAAPAIDMTAEVLLLWDGLDGSVAGGTNWGDW